ncbi:MAG: pyridoxal phosphate-dependent aminotransferase [Deltaproteobacteria bacterium]|nr:pyridoxal phosphate-dependent aminotransferase [Deltaproteobacteria bacterium]
MKFAERVTGIKPSPTLAITVKANELKAAGRDIIGFGAGEPDFDTPENISEAAIKAIRDGFTRYTAAGGIDELKDAIIGKFKGDNNLTYERSQIVVSCGAKHTIYNVMQALLERGDEIIVPAPYWVSYPDMAILADAKPVILETKESNRFKIDPKELGRAINKNTRMIIVNSPSNPTGSAYTLAEMEAIADVIVGKDIVVVSDDIYEKILFDGFKFANIANVSEEMKNQTVVVNGVSKTYAMTGWRIGYAAASKDIVAQVAKIQSQSTSNPTSISQKASVEALSGSQDAIAFMVKEFKKRRDFIVKSLNHIEGVSCLNPEGAFYVFPNISGLYGKSYKDQKITDSTTFTAYLLDEANIAVVPGIAFGADDYLRFSYATSMENIEKGMVRMKSAVEKLD